MTLIQIRIETIYSTGVRFLNLHDIKEFGSFYQINLAPPIHLSIEIVPKFLKQIQELNFET